MNIVSSPKDPWINRFSDWCWEISKNMPVTWAGHTAAVVGIAQGLTWMTYHAPEVGLWIYFAREIEQALHRIKSHGGMFTTKNQVVDAIGDTMFPVIGYILWKIFIIG